MRKDTEKSNPSYQNRSLLATVILIFAVGILLLLFAWKIHSLTRAQCYRELSVSTKEAMQDIESNFRNDRVNLRMLASVIAEQDSLTSLDVSKYLAVYDVNSLISSIGILTPENTCILLRGKETSADEVMDYQEELLLGEHISGLQPSLNTTSMVVRSFMPIRKNGKTIGLLYAEMTPSNIARAWSPVIYNGTCTFCIIDRETGEFIVNNWNKNIHKLDDLNSDSLSESIREGKSAFREIKTDDGEAVFLSYMPMEIENWEIMVSVSRAEVFASAREIEQAMTWFLAGIVFLLIFYLGWMLKSNRSSIAGAKKQANIDVLTGLQNRNCYEAYCEKIKETQNLVCIYIDANGLHELNNTKGHLAGDQMLRFIADTLKVQFGEETVYRIGGDEFIVFDRDKSSQQMNDILHEVRSEIERNQYHISAGYCIGDKSISLKEIIKTAETRMYEDKQNYYEKIGKPVRNHFKEEETT